LEYNKKKKSEITENTMICSTSEAIRWLDDAIIPFGSPTALCIEPLLIWVTKLMNVFQKTKGLN